MTKVEDMDQASGDHFPNEAEATELLATGGSLLKGVELVLGRRVDAKELISDEFLRGLTDPSLDGETRYALLLMKKGMDPKEQQITPPAL